MKNFFAKLGVKFQRFMYGRYGIDKLYRALLWFYLAAILLAILLGRAVDPVLYTVFSVIAWGIFIFATLRLFSKKRKTEEKKTKTG